MRHAIMILAHTNWNQLKTLLTTLDDPRNSIYVHVDKKAQDFDPAYFDGAVHAASLHFVQRVDVAWGGSSQITGEKILLNEAVKSHSDYYHLISGFDLPLHSMDYINDFFQQQAGKEFIMYSNFDGDMPRRIRDRVELYHPLQNLVGRHCRDIERIGFILQRALHVNRLRGKDIILGKGAQWFSITDDLAHFVIEQLAEQGKMYESSFCADEMFLQTIVANSPFRNRVYHFKADDDYAAIMRLIKWSDGDIRTFTMADYEELMTSPMLFARKFNEKVDSEIIRTVAQHVQQSK